ncbi:COMM domain [Popillia japonica]|uniref:COMM domain-containing protein 3 n=1 Tax=Popillia japonica TaxID=7064 RepID=A0AAW1N1X6_POPJA
MNLNEDLKISLIKSNNSTIISDQTYRTLLECSFNELIREQIGSGIQSIQHTKPDLIKELHASYLRAITEFARNNLTKDNVRQILNSDCIQSIQHTKPDLIKELHASYLRAITEFARNNLTKDNVRQILNSDCNFSTDRANLFSELYEKHKTRLQIVLVNIGTHLPHIVPHIVDVKWDTDYIVKTSGIDEVGGPIFRITLFVENFNDMKQENEIDKINFSCTSQELQDLVYRLKEAARHCQKIAVGH